MRIGIDLMGSDRSPRELFEAVSKAASDFPSVLFVVIITDKADIPLVPHPNVQFKMAPEEILMHDDPIKAVRTKKNSSLLIGIRLLKKRKIDAFITTGNTGALIAAASISLPKLPGIKRPALLATLPASHGPVSVLDVGGSVQLKAPLMAQFAELGVAYHRKAFHVGKPRFALLNIGAESKKGTEEHQKAYALLQTLEIEGTFIGNIEGRDLFSGKADVIVTDGFTGNVLLKTAEGTALFIFETLIQSISKEDLHALYKKFNWIEYPGATLIGLDAKVMKCHGSASAHALYNGIKALVN